MSGRDPVTPASDKAKAKRQGADISARPVTQLEMHQLVEEVMVSQRADLQRVAAALVVSLCDQINASHGQLVAAVNKSMAAAMAVRRVEIVTGPTSVKRIKRAANGDLETIEEYGSDLAAGPASVKRVKRDANGNIETIEELGAG